MNYTEVKGLRGLSFLRPLLLRCSDSPSMLVLGFASGIPYQLVYITQSAWLYEANVPIWTIGHTTSELTLAYKLKLAGPPPRSL